MKALRVVLAVAAGAALGVGLAWLVVRHLIFAPVVATVTAPAAAQPEAIAPRIPFLANRDLPDGTWLLLVPRASGEAEGDDGPDFHVIRDTAALRAAADRVWVADDQAARDRLGLLSILFLSPSIPDDRFATLLFPDGRTEEIRAFQARRDPGDATPTHDLAGLDALAEPARYRSETFDTAAAYPARMDEVQRAPDLFFLDPPLPPAASLGFPTTSTLQFPSLLLPAAEVTPERIETERQRVADLFAATFGPPGPDYAPLNITEVPCWAPEVRVVATDSPVMVNDAPVVIDGFAALTLSATLHANDDLLDRIAAAADVFAPAVQVDPGFDAAFAASLTAALPGADPADHLAFVDCWQSALAATAPARNGQSLIYYAIATDGAP
jgi:hypothetical protein